MRLRFPLRDVKIEVSAARREVVSPIFSDCFYKVSQAEFSMDVKDVGLFYVSGGNYISPGIPQDSITILPGDARSTLDEALEVRDYMAGKPWIDILILASSAAHMRRAYMIFNAALRNTEKPVYVGCSPSAYSSFNPDKWWRRKEDIQSVLGELVKIGSFMVFEKNKLRAD